MIFNQTAIILIAACPLLIASCITTSNRSEVVEEREHKPSGPGQALPTKGAVKSLCKEILGYDYPTEKIEYWKNGDTSAWLLQTKGKHGYIKSRTVIKQKKVMSCKIISTKEIRGQQITTKRFLRQFTNTSLLKPRKLTRRIDSISGATMSSTAVKNAVILALNLDIMLDSKISDENKNN